MNKLELSVFGFIGGTLVAVVLSSCLVKMVCVANTVENAVGVIGLVVVGYVYYRFIRSLVNV